MRHVDFCKSRSPELVLCRTLIDIIRLYVRNMSLVDVLVRRRGDRQRHVSEINTLRSDSTVAG